MAHFVFCGIEFYFKNYIPFQIVKVGVGLKLGIEGQDSSQRSKQSVAMKWFEIAAN